MIDPVTLAEVAARINAPSFSDLDHPIEAPTDTRVKSLAFRTGFLD